MGEKKREMKYVSTKKVSHEARQAMKSKGKLTSRCEIKLGSKKWSKEQRRSLKLQRNINGSTREPLRVRRKQKV